MAKHYIPDDLVSQDGENKLHAKVDKDPKFSKYHHEMLQLINEAITDNTLKAQIFEASRNVYISVEIAAYKEGSKKAIRFLTSVLGNADESTKPPKREKDFIKAFERFLTDYRMDRIADIHDFLEEDAEYKKLQSNKRESEKSLQVSIPETNNSTPLLDYITAVDDMIDRVKAIFYEHGFHDCAAISKAVQKGLNYMSLRTLLELEME